MGLKKTGTGQTFYKGDNLDYISFPMGGMGAGMICMEGNGGLANISIRNEPELWGKAGFHQPCIFSAFSITGYPGNARVLEGQVPSWKLYGQPGAGTGLGSSSLGLPRCTTQYFTTQFPFAHVRLSYPALPAQDKLRTTAGDASGLLCPEAEVTGWSPFIPGDADRSSLPVAGLEYTLTNPSSEKPINGVFSFHSRNFLREDPNRGLLHKGSNSVTSIKNGFILNEEGTEDAPWTGGSLCALIPDEKTFVDYRWIRDGSHLTSVWQDIEKAGCISRPPVSKGQPSPGASIYVPVTIPPGGTKKIRVLLSWYFPESRLNVGIDKNGKTGKDVKKTSCYRPWYAGRFKNIEEIAGYWNKNYKKLREETSRFTECFYGGSIPHEIVEAASANLSILKSPTVLRQTDGRLWCWEGCCDNEGCCAGSCTHVWNYAQAVAHLFPELERSLRQTEFNENQHENGHQDFRASLPIRPTPHKFYAAADGQLGGVIKVYRDWRISGDTAWLKGLWKKVKKSINYCIETWDPERKGILQEPHHNTYDVEFWGPDGMCQSFYIGALRAAYLMSKAVNDLTPLYDNLYLKAREYMEKNLFNGEYFFQEIRFKDLKTPNPADDRDSAPEEVIEIMKREGPRQQYGNGCLADGVIGSWLSAVSGLDNIIEDGKVKSHLLSVYSNNFRRSLLNHANTQRPSFALGNEGGLLVCTWPHGRNLSIPFPYTDEVFTGIEYQIASHLMIHGHLARALSIIRTARARYNGRKRNPYDEYECGRWYGRALSSYALLQGVSGIRYDAVEKTLYIRPAVKGDFSCFISTEKGYGLAGIRGGKPFMEVHSGKIEVEQFAYGKGDKKRRKNSQKR